MSVRGSRTAFLALRMAAPAFGCGDPQDIQLPLPLPGDLTETPTFARAPAQAFARIGIQNLDGAPQDACPLHFELALGSSCDRISSAGGTCHALRDGDSALVQCLVHSRSEAPGVYDVDLRLEHTSLPTLAITGSMSDAMNTSVTLQATTPDQVKIEAECVATTTAIHPGVVGFRLAACTASLDGMASPACNIELDAGFENCAR